MHERLQRRLEELKKEFSTGRAKAAELDQQQATLHQTLLRISGAIQVLEEELRVEGQGDALNPDVQQTASIATDAPLVNGAPAGVGV